MILLRKGYISCCFGDGNRATVKAAKKDEYIDRMGRENRIKVHVPKGAGAWNRVAKGRKERQGQNAWRTRVSK